MRSTVFLILVLVSGSFAGLIHGGVNLAIVEPYLDQAINIENQNLFASGEEQDTPEFWVEYNSFRFWQKGGQVLAGVILGTSVGALFGIVYAYSRNSLPGNHDVKKALVLAGIMWLVIFLIPFLKYPANPPTVGDGDTVVLRGSLYLAFIAISGFSALGFYKLSKKFQGKKKLVSAIGYGIFITVMAFVMPDNPDEITAPIDLVNGFRIMSVLGVSAFWISIPIILGALWHKFRPDSQIRETTH
ncbi:MAG: CbtA family protein [Nitrosopumilaceae archaeon]|nr:CbtA family protein [Nitrosopumilaceae archaeon]